MSNENDFIIRPPSPKKEEEIKRMQQRIERSLQNPETRKKVQDDFIFTLENLGLAPKEAQRMSEDIFEQLVSGDFLPDIESRIFEGFQSYTVTHAETTRNLIDVLHEKLKWRAELIVSQVLPHLLDIEGKIIDYGAGDGQVAQILADQARLDVEGVEVREYPADYVTIPIMIYDGQNVPVEDKRHEAGLLANVLHHEQDNENILAELDRIVQKRLVINETIPLGDTEEEMEKDKDRTFMNDYIYNRLFHNADVPVPGAFETPQAWKRRFEKYGWRIKHEQDLGFDQPTIKDRHYLLIFER